MTAPFIQGFGDQIITGFGTRFDQWGADYESNHQGSNYTIMEMGNALRDLPLQAAFQTNEGISDGTVRNIADVRAEAEAGHHIGQLHNTTVENARSVLLINPSA